MFLNYTVFPMKIKFSLVAALVILVSLYLGYAGYRQKAARNQLYQSVLDQYKKFLHPGMTRDTVRTYLNLQHTQFGDGLLPGGGNARSYKVNVGIETTGKTFRREDVYIALDFDKQPGENKGDPRAASPPSGSDVLRAIRIYRHEW
jgi:hypothetical protein